MENHSCITIRKGTLTTEAGKTKYVIPLEKDNLPFFQLTFSVSEEYGTYIVQDRADAALLAIIERCMKNKWNIASELPVSEDLLYQVETYVIPFFWKNWNKFNMNEIQLFIEPISQGVPSEGKAGTGFSAGVDSFYSVLKHTGTKYKNHNLDYLLLMQNGAAGSSVGGEKAERWMKETTDFLKPYAVRLGLPLIAIESNIPDFYKSDRCFNGDLIVSMSFVHLMRKLIGTYYWGSGYQFPNIHLDTDDTGYWDQLLINDMSVEGLHIYESGLEASRMEKVRFISANPIAQESISVCGVEIRNCGRCAKCLRTMSELYTINALDNFEQSFPVADFKKNKIKRLAEEAAADNKEYVTDILSGLKEKEQKTYYLVLLASIWYKVLWWFRRKLRNIRLVQWLYLKLNFDMLLAGRKSELRNK